MTHFLRRNRETLVDCETTKDDIHCVVVIDAFSRFLLDTPQDQQLDLIKDFDDLQEIRGQWFEAVEHNRPGLPRELAEAVFEKMADKWGLDYVVD